LIIDTNIDSMILYSKCIKWGYSRGWMWYYESISEQWQWKEGDKNKYY